MSAMLIWFRGPAPDRDRLLPMATGGKTARGFSADETFERAGRIAPRQASQRLPCRAE